MPPASISKRPLATTLVLLALWVAFYGSFTLVRPELLDDADSVHAEVAREMLLRHDYVTLYANGIRYLEKAPLLYWSMAACMRVAQLFGHSGPDALAVAARVPLALTMLALAFAVEAFARRAFSSHQAGLYAALILLSSPGMFLFTRITLPDAMVCLWLTLAMYAFWLTEQPPDMVILTLNGEKGKNPRISPEAPPDLPPRNQAGVPHSSQPHRDKWDVKVPRLPCFAFTACCALGVLTKGLIGIVFPIAIVAIYLILTRGLRRAITRVRQLRPLSGLAIFFAIAAPWHLAIALANPTQGHPGGLTFAAGHWQVPLPTDGNVHGWAWFYFVNEQLLRYLNLRVPRDYDTVPLWLFWGLILIWLMPWSAFVFKALVTVPRLLYSILRDLWGSAIERKRGRMRLKFWGQPFKAMALLTVWAATPLLFFSLSTRQEYYVLPALPPVAILIGQWLIQDSAVSWSPVTDSARLMRRAMLRCTAVLLALAAIFATAALYFILHTHTPAANTDLAALLQQNPGDYAMSMGHFLDLNAQALGLFRLPLALAALSLFLGPLASLILRRKARPHAATLALAAGAFGFLLAAHLGLQTFAPVLSSQQLAAAIAPQLKPNDLLVIHQEYEYGSALGFYLQRPAYGFAGLLLRSRSAVAPLAPSTSEEAAGVPLHPVALNPIHILTDAEHNGTPSYGRSSNLWYGSFFPDAPQIFETTQSLAQKWAGPQRIFLWQDLAGEPSPLPAVLTPVYVLAKSGGKEVVSNRPSQTGQMSRSAGEENREPAVVQAPGIDAR